MRVVFQNLAPETDYGRFCFLEEPLLDAYTVLGRSIKVSIHECKFEGLKTGRKPASRLVEELEQELISSRLNYQKDDYSKQQNNDKGGYKSLFGRFKNNGARGAPEAAFFLVNFVILLFFLVYCWKIGYDRLVWKRNIKIRTPKVKEKCLCSNLKTLH